MINRQERQEREDLDYLSWRSLRPWRLEINVQNSRQFAQRREFDIRRKGQTLAALTKAIDPRDAQTGVRRADCIPRVRRLKTDRVGRK